MVNYKNKKVKILHLISLEKFTESYIELVNTNYDEKEHCFLVWPNANNQYTLNVVNKNVQIINKKLADIHRIMQKIKYSEKIILHGFPSYHLLIYFFARSSFLKKVYWVVWGGDLYQYYKRNSSAKLRLEELIRKKIIRCANGIITHVKGDYDLAVKWYNTRATYFYSFMYTSNSFKDYHLGKKNNSDGKYIIQVGNSADPSNNHIEVFKRLMKYKDEHIEIICPLSYGDKAYTQKIIIYGTEIFGDKFVPIIDFIPFDKYLKILAKVDIAIFNHRRQQALGNIITLLGLGKKVYIREEITSWQFCIDHGLKVFNVNDDYKDIFVEIDRTTKKRNINNVKKYFSAEKLIEDWGRIFNA